MLKKLKNLKINFALIAFMAYAVKMILVSASFADSIVMGVLAATYGYTQFLKRFQPYKLDETVAQDLLEVKTALSKLKLSQSRDKLQKNKYF